MRVAYEFTYSKIRQVEQGIKQDLYIFIDFWQRNMSTLMDIKQYLYSRTNKSKLDGEWMSLFEIEAYLENGWVVYLVKDKDKRIEKEIRYISEI